MYFCYVIACRCGEPHKDLLSVYQLKKGKQWVKRNKNICDVRRPHEHHGCIRYAQYSAGTLKDLYNWTFFLKKRVEVRFHKCLQQ